MTWEENRIKAVNDRINGINNKVATPVKGVHKITGQKVEFHSAREASRSLKIGQSHISKCCKGVIHYNSAGGYTWQYNIDNSHL
jgi:ribosomal protein S20